MVLLRGIGIVFEIVFEFVFITLIDGVNRGSHVNPEVTGLNRMFPELTKKSSSPASKKLPELAPPACITNELSLSRSITVINPFPFGEKNSLRLLLDTYAVFPTTLTPDGSSNLPVPRFINSLHGSKDTFICLV